jgi:hypothetical protein
MGGNPPKIGKMTPTSETDIRELKELISNLDKKIDVFQARTEEKLDGVAKRLDNLETRERDRDNRFWALVGGAFLALFGLLAKMAFFPSQPMS